jgi:hypothetical protein
MQHRTGHCGARYLGRQCSQALCECEQQHGVRYIPVLMAMARIYWDLENYQMVEKIFRQSAGGYPVSTLGTCEYYVSTPPYLVVTPFVRLARSIPAFLFAHREIPFLPIPSSCGMIIIFINPIFMPFLILPFCAEFCSEHDVWRLNVAHTFFMQVRAGLPCLPGSHV